MTGPILEVRDLSVAYGRVEALHHVSLKVEEGQIVTVIGPNGAGKTTLLSAVMGLLPAKGGEVRFLGKRCGVGDVERQVADGMTLVPEKRELFGSMTVQDNLLLGGYVRRHTGMAALHRQLEEVYQLFPRLRDRRGQEASTLSGGERQMLAVGRALVARPRLLMLDEPSLGLAPLIVREIYRVIAELRRLGAAILLVEQNARAALEVADYAYVLETGEVANAGAAAEIAANAKVIESYLGLGKRA